MDELRPESVTTESSATPLAKQAPSTSPTSAAPIGGESKMDKAKKMFFLVVGSIVGVWSLLVGIGFSMVGVGGKGSSLANFLSQPPRTAIANFSFFAYALFAFVAFLVLVYFMIALVRLMRSPKEDLAHKSKFIKTIGSAVLLGLVLGGWLIGFLFLSSRAETFSNIAGTAPLATTPASTLGLSAPVMVTFDATGFASTINAKAYTIVSYVWDFGDNTTGTGPVVAHEYKDKGRNNGIFNATLEVTLKDASGKLTVNKDYKVVVSIKNIKPTVNFSVSPEKGAAPLTVNFDGTDSIDPDGQITAYSWDLDGNGEFGDSTEKKASKTYTTSGKYEVGLQLTDNSGDTNVVRKVVDVSDTFALKSVIDLQTEVTGKLTIGKSYLFDAKRSSSPNGKITKYSWNFGDNTAIQSGRNVSHAFATIGTYAVTLTVTDEVGATATTTKKVSVTEPSKTPISLISSVPAAINGKIIGPAPLAVTFDASKSTDADDNIVEYAWDFNGDQVSDKFGATTNYTFADKGSYIVTLRITDSDDNTRTAQVTVEATPPGLQAKISALPITGIVPLTTKFDASASTYVGGQIISYEWDFGDGSPKRQDAANISYKYSKVGIYTAKVTAIGSDGKKSTDALTITVQNVPLKACYTTNRKEGKAPVDIIFNADCSTGSVAKYSWDLDGNGVFNDGASPQLSKSFSEPGVYTISLEVSDTTGVVDTFTDTITITQ